MRVIGRHGSHCCQHWPTLVNIGLPHIPVHKSMCLRYHLQALTHAHHHAGLLQRHSSG